MIEIVPYQLGDQSAVDEFYRRIAGPAAADSLRQRWERLHGHNPALAGGPPRIWLAKDGATIVGVYATIPVRLVVNGSEADAAWGADLLVDPERRGAGIAAALFGAWERHNAASIGLGLTDASHGLFKKLQWPHIDQVPRFVKPLSRRAASDWQPPPGRLSVGLSVRWNRALASLRRFGDEIQPITRFDQGFTDLWERIGPKFALAVRRDADYLNWKYLEAAPAPYSIFGLSRDGRRAGYVVYRELDEPERRTTLLVDYLADPADPGALATLLRWVDRQAYAAGSDLVRTFAKHTGFQTTLQSNGYHRRLHGARFVAKINALPVPADYYQARDGWHVTIGDSDCDR